VGIKVLAAELKNNQQVKYLGLSQNEFVEDGVDYLMEIIQQGALTHWQLSSTRLPLEDIARSFATRFPELNYFSGSWIRASSTEKKMIITKLPALNVPVAESQLRPNKKPTKISHRRLWGLRRSNPEQKREDESTISRRIERVLARNKDHVAKPNGLLFGAGSARLALFHELVRAHDEIPEQQRRQDVGRVQEFVLKCAQLLATAVPHYGCPMLCSSMLSSCCQVVLDASVLDEKTAVVIDYFWKQEEIHRALAASQRGCFVFPQQMTSLFDCVKTISQSNYVPTTEDILYWKDSELVVHEHCFSNAHGSFRLVAGQRNILLKLYEKEEITLVIAASFRDIQNQTIPTSKFNAVIAYSEPPWTDEEISKFGCSKRVYPVSSLAGIGRALKEIAFPRSQSTLGR